MAVIGGGLTGVVAALHLARKGAQVNLFEQHTVGFGASGRNGAWRPPACRSASGTQRGCTAPTLDRMVRAGRHDGVYYSMGYAGHGVQMATYMGRQMAEYMSGVPEADIWSDFKFRRIPGHFGPAWFLPFAGAYYKFKDRVSRVATDTHRHREGPS